MSSEHTHKDKNCFPMTLFPRNKKEKFNGWKKLLVQRNHTFDENQYPIKRVISLLNFLFNLFIQMESRSTLLHQVYIILCLLLLLGLIVTLPLIQQLHIVALLGLPLMLS